MSDHSADPKLVPVIRERRSLRAFDPTQPSEAVLRRVFDAARWAPSGGNGQPWRFVVARAGSEAFDRLGETLRAGNAWARSAPVLILALVKTVHDRPGKPVRANRRALLDLGLAVENLLLQAAEEGIGTHPMAGFDADDAAGVVGMPSENHQAVLMIALGRWGDASLLEPEVRAKDERPRTRLPLDEIVFEDVFGSPAPFAQDGSETVDAS